MISFARTILLCTTLSGFPFYLYAATIDNLDLVISSPSDERVVLKDRDGNMSVLKKGDVVPGTTTTVQQILGDRILLQDSSNQTQLLDGIWLYRAQGSEHSRQEKMSAGAKELPQTALKMTMQRVESKSTSTEKKNNNKRKTVQPKSTQSQKDAKK